MVSSEYVASNGIDSIDRILEFLFHSFLPALPMIYALEFEKYVCISFFPTSNNWDTQSSSFLIGDNNNNN